MDVHKLYENFGRRFRHSRMALFIGALEISGGERILDVGGTPRNWELIDKSLSIVLLNHQFPGKKERARHVWVIGDARQLPFSADAFDVAFSNSVIEHLGCVEGQRTFAAEASRVGRDYFVQTPNRYFPIELHFLTPVYQFLPRWIQRRGSRFLSVRGLLGASKSELDRLASELRLLNERELRELFPDGRVVRERFAGFVKSLVVFRIRRKEGVSASE
jgi:hypothetical protein